MSKKNIKCLITVLLCSLLLSVSLIGCGRSSSGENISMKTKTLGGREFVFIQYDGDYGYIYVDVETRVQYLQISGGNAGRMTVLLDAEGKPILYEGDLEVSE